MAIRDSPPLAMEWLGSLRILGVTIASDLSVLEHDDALLNAGVHSIYTLYCRVALNIGFFVIISFAAWPGLHAT